jgi:hypothetical protein
MNLLEKIYLAFLTRGSEVDNPENDEKYLKLERCLTLELAITKISIGFPIKKEWEIEQAVDERDSLLKELQIT